MNVTVQLSEPYWRHVQRKQLSVELPEGATVADMLVALGENFPALADPLAQIDPPPTVFLEDELADPATSLSEGSRPVLVWALVGGSK
jgi:sulfur carrier protein ThiS